MIFCPKWVWVDLEGKVLTDDQFEQGVCEEYFMVFKTGNHTHGLSLNLEAKPPSKSLGVTEDWQ